MSVDTSIDKVANSVYGRPSRDLNGQQARELVKRLRLQGLHAEADTLWSWVLRDSIRELGAEDTGSR